MMPVWPLVSSVLSFMHPVALMVRGWGDGKARRWLVDEFLKERRVDGRNDLRLYNSILYKHFWR